MGVGRKSAGRLPGLRRVAGPILLALLGLAVVFHLGGGWYFASLLDERALSGEARRAALTPDYTIEVLAIEPGAITLRDPGNEQLERDGTFALNWEGGAGIVGKILERRSDGSIRREFEPGPGTIRIPGTMAELDRRVFPGDPQIGLGIAFEEVTFPGELGDYPAWYIPGKGTTWFIFVHGNGMTRRDGLRMLPPLVEAGLPVLVPTYRNDEGAPANKSGRLTYGKEEWRDLESAVDYALANGAENVVLEGLSMGGAVVSAFMRESPLAFRVIGVIFDAPLLDFEAAVEFQAKDERLPLIGLPLPLTLLNSAEYLAERRFGIDWDYTRYFPGPRPGPILLIHGIEDEDVPIATSDKLAALHPEAIFDYWRVPGAGHVEAWNVDPAEYERRMLAFLTSIGAID